MVISFHFLSCLSPSCALPFPLKFVCAPFLFLRPRSPVWVLSTNSAATETAEAKSAIPRWNASDGSFQRASSRRNAWTDTPSGWWLKHTKRMVPATSFGKAIRGHCFENMPASGNPLKRTCWIGLTPWRPPGCNVVSFLVRSKWNARRTWEWRSLRERSSPSAARWQDANYFETRKWLFYGNALERNIKITTRNVFRAYDKEIKLHIIKMNSYLHILS